MNPTIRIHPRDSVVIARMQLLGGTAIAEEGITIAGLIPPGHKVATRAIAKGDDIRRYDQIIGHATQPIAPGQHVHTHNREFAEFARTHEPGAGVTPTAYSQPPATFDGIVRADGRVATRNYIGVLTSVNCSATAARAIADQFRRDIHPEALAAFPNVDGVVALTHGMGCATDSEGEELRVLRRIGHHHQRAEPIGCKRGETPERVLAPDVARNHQEGLVPQQRQCWRNPSTGRRRRNARYT